MIRRETSISKNRSEHLAQSQSQNFIFVTELAKSMQKAGRNPHNHPLGQQLTTYHHRTQKNRTLSRQEHYRAERHNRM